MKVGLEIGFNSQPRDLESCINKFTTPYFNFHHVLVPTVLVHTASYSSWENRESLNCLLRKSRTWRRKEMWPWSLVSCCLFLFQLRYDLVVVFILIKVLSFSFNELSKKKHTPKQLFLYPILKLFAISKNPEIFWDYKKLEQANKMCSWLDISFKEATTDCTKYLHLRLKGE